ncbi:MAG: efflux RND transporter periplasmic adaptor subunit [Bryobacteraceae bacterium]
MSSFSNSMPEPETGRPAAPASHGTLRPRRPGRRYVWPLVGLGVLAGGAVYLLADRPSGGMKPAQLAAIPTAEVRIGSIERTIRVSGQISARRYADIKVPQQRGRGSGSLTLLRLIEGGVQVKQGDVVAQLDPEYLLQQIDDFEDTLNQSEANLRTLKARQAVDWENLQQTVRSAKAARDRAAHDYSAAEVKTEVEREILRLALEEAEATYKQQLEALPLKQISFECDLRTQEINYQQQLRRRERLRNDLKNYTFAAPMDGLVVIQTFTRPGSSDLVQYQVGDQVQPGQVILKIVDTSTMQLEAQANQTEASQLRVGQPAKVTLDAFPELEFSGRVSRVGAMAIQGWRENYYIRTVPVVVEIHGSDPRLIPDMTGAATIRVAYKENALLVPLSALRTEGEKSYVRVRTANGFERREVAVGMKNPLEAEILSGLRAGERVALQ